MPYIHNSERVEFNAPIDYIQGVLRRRVHHRRKGALNYVVSRITLGCFGRSYHEISDMVSALRDAATEIERRLMGPREDHAIGQNGDLPEYDER